MGKIKWGIIGCGDVTELKSGPAFNKVENSELVAVMRRDAAKADDYARRHHVPHWYSDAEKLVNDPEINAIYVATPPSTHEEFTLAAFKAGKNVYVEKPMSVDYASSMRMVKAADKYNKKLVVAHYRREQPLFKKIKQLVKEKAIGDILFTRLELSKPPLSEAELADEKIQWRINPAVAGGGLFNDLSPHQLDLMYYFFGPIDKVMGISVQQGKQYTAPDMVAGTLLFKSGITFSGTWCFNVAPELTTDLCEIVGTKGKISFSFFSGTTIHVLIDGSTTAYTFDPLMHVQQPMIGAIVKYFSGADHNPCSGAEGAEIMRWIDGMSGKD